MRFFGETIAAVAATTRKIAEQAVQAIEVEYEELPAVFSIEEARKAGAPRVWDEGNVLPPIIETFGNIKKSFEDADSDSRRRLFYIEAFQSTARTSSFTRLVGWRQIDCCGGVPDCPHGEAITVCGSWDTS